MRHKGHMTTPLLVLLFLICSQTDARQCHLSCAGTTGNLLKFQPGKTYQYKLDGTSITTLPGAKNDVSKVGIEANVEISATSDCEHVLVVSGAKTIAPDGKKHNLDGSLVNNPIKFGLQNGKIVELCTSEGESLNALNIKRAVLSLLQSTVLKDSGYATQHETDVFGSCPTSFEFSKHGGGVIIKKSRDLTKCAHREDLNVPYSTSTYFIPSDVQSSPLLASTFHSEQKLEGGVLKSASSEELYDYNPMSSVEATTKVKINTKLTLVDQSDKAAPAVNAVKGKSLIFQAQHTGDYKGGVETMAELLRGSCDTRTVEGEGASKFSKLVRAMSNAPKGDLLKVFQLVKAGQGFKEKDIAKKMYMDALANANSGSSVEVMAELIKNKEVTGLKANYFYMILGTVKHATKATLLSVMPLLDDKATADMYLNIGTLGGRFCKENNCAKYPEIETFETKLAAPLLNKGCKPATKQEEDLLLGSLKGLANMRYLTKKVVTKLADYAGDRDVKARIRVALLETMRSDANKPEIKKVAEEVFRNPSEDSEIRIKAYLVLVECPCGKVADTVLSVLESERSFQVGSFVVSHLRNIRASTNPEKASAKHHLGPIIAFQKFPIDFRKYSQNYGFSYSADMLNLGASSEANIIYSQKSYVPRSLSLNLTSHMFGRSYNWLEMDVRMENVEKELEKIFGPRGKLRKNKYNEVYDDAREYATSLLESAAERYEKALRPKRSITRDQLNALAKTVHLEHESEDDVDIDVALKVYGAERLWLRYHNNVDKINADKLMNRLFGELDKSLNSAKNLNFDYRKHFSFMDEELVYPTGLGLALKVKILGSTAYRIKVDGKLDVPALIRDPSNSDARIQLVPSAAIELRGDIVLDGIAFEGGVKASLNLHTSTGSDVTIRFIDGHGVDIKFGLPVKKQDILTLNSEVTTIIRQHNHAEKNLPVVFDVKREKYQGCFDQLNEVLGVTVCGEVDVPWEGHRSLSPSYGPSKLSLHVDKDDDSLTTYHFKVFADDREGVRTFEVLFDTPNSRVNRKMLLFLEGSLEDKKYLKMHLKSPWTSASFETAFIATDKELSLNARLAHDDVEYSIKTGAIKSKQGNTVRFEPILEYSAPEQAKSTLIGSRGGPKTSSQVSVSGAVVVEGNDIDKKWKYESLSLNTPKTKYTINGGGSYNKEGGDLDIVVHYDKEHIKIKGHAKEKDNHLSTQLIVLPSQYPDFNINLKWDALKDKEHGKYESKLSAVHGPDPNSDSNKIILHNKLELNEKERIYATENTVTYPVFHLDGHLGLRVTPKSFKTDLKGKFDKYSAQLLLKGEVNTKKEGDFNGELRWELMGNSVGFTTSRKVLKNHQSKFQNVLDIKPGGRYELNALATHKFNEKDLDCSVDVDIVLPADPKNLKLKGGLKHNEAITSGHLNAVSGNQQYLLTDFNIKTNDKPSGAYQLKIMEYINANGDFAFDGTNFKAKTSLDLPKVQRQMEGKANFIVSKSKYSGSADFCWDTKNPEKSLKLQTDTSIQDNSVDSKNTLIFGGQKTVVNLKGSETGEDKKGSVAGEIELILPNGHKIQFELRDEHDLTNEKNVQGKSVLKFVHQESGKEPFKATLETVGKSIDLENLNFDGQITLHVKSPDKKELSSHLIMKKTPKGDEKWIIQGELAASGSLMKHPLTVKLDSEIPTELFDDDSKELDKLPPLNYHFSLSSGPELNLESSAKIAGNTITGNFNAKLPHDSPITSVKWTTSNLIDIDDDDKFKVKCSNELHWNKDKFIKVNGEANCEPNGLNYQAEWETNDLPRRKVTGSAHWNEDKNARKADANVALTWEGKNADISLKMERNNENVGVIHLLGTTPEQGKFDFLLKNKLVKNGKGVHSDLVLTTKEKKISMTSKLELVESHPLIELVMDHPDGKYRFLWKVDHKGERHWASELKAKWTGGRIGGISIDSEVFLKSIDNFFIKHNLDFPQMNMKKSQIELSNRPGRGEGKKITFTVKKDDKLIISANSNYIIKEDGNEKIIEGNGNMKVDDQQYPLNFKGTWIATDNEKAAKLLIKSGKKSINLSYKQNENEFHMERTACLDSGECSKAQILNRIRGSGFDEYEHTVIFELDLHLLDPRFRDLSYVGSYKRNGQTVDHLIETKLGDEVKFKYNGYLHDKEAGLLLTLPKRTVGAEVKYDINTKGNNNGGTINIEADLYLNKEKNDKLCFISYTNVEKHQDTVKLSGETKFTHPALSKNLSVKGHYTATGTDTKGELVLDLFKQDNQKIIINFNSAVGKEGSKVDIYLKSEECKLDIYYLYNVHVDGKGYSFHEKLSYLDSTGVKRQAEAKYEINNDKIYILFQLPSIKLIEISSAMINKDNTFSIKSDYHTPSNKYHEIVSYDSGKNIATYILKWNGNTLESDFGVTMGQNAVLKVSFNNKVAAEINVALDEVNFLKSNYNYDPEVIKNGWHSIAESINSDVKVIDDAFTKHFNSEQEEAAHFINCLTQCVPDFNGLLTHVKEEFKQIKNEAEADPDVASALNDMKKGFGTLIEQLSIFEEEFKNLLATIGELVGQFAHTLSEVLKKIGPKLAESFEQFSKIVVSLLEQYVKAYLQLVDQFLNELKKYKDDLDAVTKVITDLVHEVGKQFAKVAHVIHEEIKKFIELNVEQLKELPITNMIKEKYNELAELRLPEEVWMVLNEIVENIKPFLPTTECEDFISTLSTYISKILKQEEVNDEEAAQELYDKLIKAIKSLIAKVNELTPKQQQIKPEKYISTIPLATWLKLPVGGVRVSTWNLVKSPDFPALIGSLETFAVSLNPIENIPPFFGFAQIIQSTQIITFDNHHYEVKGLCSYVLAEDYVDRNFSVVGHFRDAKLEAVTVWDESHSLTLRKDGAPLKDGTEAEYPLKAGLLKAWKTPNIFGLRSKAGIILICNSELNSCTLQVSGFYFNKLRGLFGNFNYERYDDLFLPEGKVDSDTSHFCNSWKVDNSCPDIPQVPELRQRERICTEMFTEEDSDLILGRPWLPLGPYRDACDHLVPRAGGNKKKAACEVATSYVYVAQKKGAYLLDIPSECIVCNIDNKKIGDDDSTIVTPGKAADVVVLVDVLKENEEIYKNYIQPLVPKLKAELQKKGINDIHVVLASFNSPTNRWTNYHSVNGKLEFNGPDCVVQFEESPEPRNETWLDRLLLAKHELNEELGNTQRMRAYEDIIHKFNFRPHALKTIIGVHSERCESELPLNILLPVRILFNSLMTADRGIVWNLITPINGLATDLSNGVTNNDIVGFSDDEMFTLDKGNLKQEADYDTDFCLNAAHTTGGFVFPRVNFRDYHKDGKGGVFIEKTAELIVKSMLNSKKPLECECSLIQGLIPRPECELED